MTGGLSVGEPDECGGCPPPDPLPAPVLTSLMLTRTSSFLFTNTLSTLHTVIGHPNVTALKWWSSIGPKISREPLSPLLSLIKTLQYKPTFCGLCAVALSYRRYHLSSGINMEAEQLQRKITLQNDQRRGQYCSTEILTQWLLIVFRKKNETN